ncbi:MAG: HNH endonuclease [Planctomycetota bacterium]
MIIDKTRGVATVICTDRDGYETGRTLIDLRDLDRVRQHRWCIWSTVTPGSKRQRRGRRYVAANLGGKRVSLHRFVFGDPPNYEMVPDHIDGNGLNNQRKNLRWASRSENALNTSQASQSRSGFWGVTWYRDKRRWAAEVWSGKRRVHRSYHLDAIDAARARDAAAVRIQGPFARLNFPEARPA